MIKTNAVTEIKLTQFDEMYQRIYNETSAAYL
jgi:hypothetical protein